MEFMNTKNAISALAALAQDSRLAVYRLLVQAGPAGLPAGKTLSIGGHLNTPTGGPWNGQINLPANGRHATNIF